MEEPESINKRRVMEYYRYKGLVGEIKYYWRFITGRILQTMALLAPHPKMIVALNKMRGVKIGKHVYIGQLVYMDSRYPGLITIDDYASIGTNSMIFAHSDPGYSIGIEKNYYPSKIAPTTIGKGAWIAPGVIIFCGVSVGESSVVAAGSVVTKDVEPYTVVAGNPARRAKRMEAQDDKL